MESLTAEIGCKESARFIKKAEINESSPWSQKIEIPDGAQYLRTKGKDVKYFENHIDTSKNGFIAIPEGATFVSFPEYRRRTGHVIHGEPAFYYR